MRAVAILTSLASAAAALPSSLAGREPEANSLQARQQRILDYTVDTWPTQATVYNNQSYELIFLTPETDTSYTFGFRSFNPLNSGFDNIFGVSGEGLETIAERVASGGYAERKVEKTNKPFRLTIDRV